MIVNSVHINVDKIYRKCMLFTILCTIQHRNAAVQWTEDQKMPPIHPPPSTVRLSKGVICLRCLLTTPDNRLNFIANIA